MIANHGYSLKDKVTASSGDEVPQGGERDKKRDQIRNADIIHDDT